MFHLHLYLRIPFCSLLTQGLAGIQPVNVAGIENVSECLISFHCSIYSQDSSPSFSRLTSQSSLKATLPIFGKRNRSWRNWIQMHIILFCQALPSSPNEVCYKFDAPPLGLQQRCNILHRSRTQCGSFFSVGT